MRDSPLNGVSVYLDDLLAAHSASKVDLPQPAGADTTVSVPRTPRSTSSTRRGRGVPQAGGAVIFDW